MARILIVERDVPVRCLLEVVCERLGHEPVAWDGKGISGAPFDLVIVEPTASEALGLARRTRDRDPSAGLLFVSTREPTSETRELDPVAHAVKPVSLDVLEAAITRALS